MYTKSQGQFKTAPIHSSYDGFSKLADFQKKKAI